MADEKEVKTEEEEELDLDDLEQVSGGVSLRNVKKVKTVEIDQDTINRI
jgi:hypothetical protein